MNILFILYGDLGTNSSVPLALHAAELEALGHRCAVAVPQMTTTDRQHNGAAVRSFLYADILAAPETVFPDGRPADMLHAWTPREAVRRFVTCYLAARPTPWVIYLEDNEEWISRGALSLVGLHQEVLLQHTDEVITTWTPDGISHPLRYRNFIGLADAAVVIQDKLAAEVPPWVPCSTVMPGVDLELFAPAPAQPELRRRYGLAGHERAIVYPGGLNDFTRPGLEALCCAVALINRRGVPCRLLRSGPVALDFLGRMTPEEASYVSDLGPLPRAELPGLLALADLFVQPGTPNEFEDLRLPGKLPELLAMGRPVVTPNCNIAALLRDGVNAVLHRTGSPEELAEKCLGLLLDPERAASIGAAGRRFAETHFDPGAQSARLEEAYRLALAAFQPEVAAATWETRTPSDGTTGQLARKLRMLAGSKGVRPLDTRAMMSAYARLLDFSQERAASLEIGIAVRDREIAGLKEAVSAQEANIANLGREFAAAQGTLALRERELAERHARVSLLEQTAAGQAARIAAVEASLSWQITKPFRAALHFLRYAFSRRP